MELIKLRSVSCVHFKLWKKDCNCYTFFLYFKRSHVIFTRIRFPAVWQQQGRSKPRSSRIRGFTLLLLYADRKSVPTRLLPPMRHLFSTPPIFLTWGGVKCFSCCLPSPNSSDFSLFPSSLNHIIPFTIFICTYATFQQSTLLRM